jgi:dynein heavy chain
MLEEFNTMNRSKAMNLVLFTDAIEHIVKIHRVITTQYGNALLVGVGGSGRKSLSELATFIANYEMVQLEIIKGYGMKDWREDMINSLFAAAGIDSIPHVFLMPDTSIINESFVEDINNILNNGKIPNLYATEDIQKIIEDMKDQHKSDDLIKGMEDGEIMQVFEDCAKNSIHVILAFSPIGGDFVRRLRMFPALVNCCTIDWFLPWPAEALKSVAYQFLGKIEDLPMIDGIVAICVDMQERVH